MKVFYSEYLASHTGPEPHGDFGNTMADACVENGGKCRQDIKFPNHILGGADLAA